MKKLSVLTCSRWGDRTRVAEESAGGEVGVEGEEWVKTSLTPGLDWHGGLTMTLIIHIRQSVILDPADVTWNIGLNCGKYHMRWSKATWELKLSPTLDIPLLTFSGTDLRWNHLFWFPDYGLLTHDWTVSNTTGGTDSKQVEPRTIKNMNISHHSSWF